MRAMRVHQTGAPLCPDDIPAPEPGPGEVRLRVHACGVNFADTLMVAGRYQEKPALPFAPGLEVCGTVQARGAGVTAPADGARVAALIGHGGFAEAALAPAAACVAVPEAMADTEAAAFLVAYGTSHLGLEAARLAPGETLLVLGASGGVGLTAVELGRLMGATVIACARGPEKLAAARAAGAHHLIDSETADLRAEAKALGGIDVLYDPVGGAQFDAAFRAMKPFGRLLPLGFASGDIPAIPANILMVKNLTAIGLYWGGVAKADPGRVARSLAQLFAWYSEGRLHPHVSHVVPLARADEALALLTERRATGKVVVTP